MLSWFRRKAVAADPTPSPKTPANPAPVAQDKVTFAKANPGIVIRGKVAFSNSQRQWTEDFDAVDLADQVLRQQGHTVRNRGNTLEHVGTGCVIKPQLVEFQPLDAGGVRTVTTVELALPLLGGDGIFEYQHSTGESMQDSIRKGLDQWAQVDLVPLLDSLREKPAVCTMMEMQFPATGDRPARKRRAVLGPVAHVCQNPQANPATGTDAEHPFCPCCLLTNTFAAFKSHIEGDGVFAIRLFAMRDEHGKAAADCRINGLEYEPGKAALREYVEKWPQRGVEFRKQYVVVHTAAGTDAQR